MSLTAKEGAKGDYEIPAEGVYIAKCFKLIDLGTQWIEFAGEKKQQAKVLVSWELLDPEANMKDSRPFAVSKRYTASLHEKSALRKDLQSWRGKKFTAEELEGFNLKKVLGAYCQLQIVHTQSGESTYANVDTIMSTREKPTGINPLASFDLDEPDLELFETFSDKLKETIKASPEWRMKEQETQAVSELKPGQKPDVVITDIGDEPIDLADIPF